MTNVLPGRTEARPYSTMTFGFGEGGRNALGRDGSNVSNKYSAGIYFFENCVGNINVTNCVLGVLVSSWENYQKLVDWVLKS
jgi:hypothetical protein